VSLPIPRILRWILAVAVVALVVTGLWLTRYYRPHPQRIYTFDDLPAGIDRSLRLADAMRRLHNLAAITFVGSVVVSAFYLVRAVAPIVARFVLPAALFVAAAAGLLTGVPLAWDQLALTAITVNSDMRGVWHAAFSDQIRFILIGNSEVSQSTYRTMLLAHLLVPLLLGVAAVVIARRAQPPSPPEPRDEPTP
jgi:quinol-cytochrome oxidoreductase complex cytochrome b subunit